MNVPPRTRRYLAATVTACLIVLVVGTWTGLAPASSPSAQVAVVGASEIQSAITSLSHAGGPASGRPLSCSSPSTESASCTVRGAGIGPSTLGASWHNITSKVVPLPSGRFTSMTWDASDGYVLLYGGAYYNATDSLQVVRDTWTYLNGVWTNITTQVTGGPPPNAEVPAMAYDPWTTEVVLFGGYTATSTDLSLTWTYHAKVWTNITATAGTPPSARQVPIFVADLASNQMILYGGELGSGGFDDDTWLFSGSAWSNISGSVGTSPPALAGPSGAYDPAESGIVIVGTNPAGPPYVGNTFLFKGGAWENLTAAEAGVVPPTDIGWMGYYKPTSTLLLVASVEFLAGTGSEAYYPVEWSFSDGNWTNITASGFVPASGSVAAVATDPSGALLMFGGGYLTETTQLLTQWMYAYSAGPSAVQVTASPSTLDVGMATNISASFSGGLSPYSTNLTFGDGHFAVGTMSASHSYAAYGTPTIWFNVTDLTGASAGGSTTVNVFPLPSGAEIHASANSTTTGTTVDFASSVAGGAPPYTSLWNFGDGTSATTTSASHAYSSAGTYTVALTLKDSVGKTTNATLLVTVSAASSSGFSLTSGIGLDILLGIVVVAAVVVVLALVSRRGRRPTVGTPPPAAAPMYSSAPGGTAPPAPPPGPPPPGGPPPGA